jgi:hypothetical protein
VYFAGDFYNFDKAVKGKLAWRCCKRGCKGRIQTDLHWRMQVELPKIITAHVEHAQKRPGRVKAELGYSC